MITEKLATVFEPEGSVTLGTWNLALRLFQKPRVDRNVVRPDASRGRGLPAPPFLGFAEIHPASDVGTKQRAHVCNYEARIEGL